MASLFRTEPTISMSEYLRNRNTENINLYTTCVGVDLFDFNLFMLYREQMFYSCNRVTLEDQDRAIYNKDPKRMSKDIWNTADLFFVILYMNNMEKIEDMDLTGVDYLYIPSDSSMNLIASLCKKHINNTLPDLDPEAD